MSIWFPIPDPWSILHMMYFPNPWSQSPYTISVQFPLLPLQMSPLTLPQIPLHNSQTNLQTPNMRRSLHMESVQSLLLLWRVLVWSMILISQTLIPGSVFIICQFNPKSLNHTMPAYSPLTILAASCTNSWSAMPTSPIVVQFLIFDSSFALRWPIHDSNFALYQSDSWFRIPIS